MHESEVVGYIFLITLTMDTKLVQTLTGSPKHFEAFRGFNKMFSSVLMCDKASIDTESDSASHNSELAARVEKFITNHAGHACKGSDEEASFEDKEPEGESGNQLDDSVLNNMMVNV